ncbi:MAG: hypothetical protein IKS93_02205 [Methanobrevibacter sp.]|nr:hypothetical protein [Methanobrevibacter sp.]
MKLYDPKFVHFEWTDELKGKKVILAHTIKDIKEFVGSGNKGRFFIAQKGNDLPFTNGICECEFAYYDPNYEIKYAYWEMGYDIYYKPKDKNCDWEKVSDNTNFLYVIDDPDYEFKIDDFDNCDELAYKLSIQLEFHKGNTVYYRNKTLDNGGWHPFSKATAGKDYQFDFDIYEYKTIDDLFEDTPDEVCTKGNSNRVSTVHEYSKKDLEKDNDISHKIRDTIQESLSDSDLYRPFKDTDELIAYWEKHYGNGNRPEHTMPLIWLKDKDTGNVFLITGYDEDEYVCLGDDWWLSMKELFEQCKFLDGNCCGKVKEIEK